MGFANGVADTAQVDFSISKHFNKWELGLVGYGSADLDYAGPRLIAAGPGGPLGQTSKQSQFALGGLIGYNFGPVIAQVYMTRDIGCPLNSRTTLACRQHASYLTRAPTQAAWIDPKNSFTSDFSRIESAESSFAASSNCAAESPVSLDVLATLSKFAVTSFAPLEAL